MQPPPSREVSKVCFHGCCPSTFPNLLQPHNPISKSKSTSAAYRNNFAAETSSLIFPNTQFTNHESLPSLQESFSEFINAYPQYFESDAVDQIRAQEYYNLAENTCMDYIGTGLFSLSQQQKQDYSTGFPFFSISYKTGYLKSQLLYGSQESELESAIKKRIMGFLNISENDYSMVFTANRTSGFKLVAESYPFQSYRKLLSVYDHKSEAVDAMISSSEKRGAQVMSAEFSWPRLRIQSAKLKKMVVRKKQKKKKRGIFVFPVHSGVTGARYPYLWMRIAQENGWHILIDACALGPKDMDSFGLSLFQPDFLICSFYKVFGENPSGFGCLFVKKSTVSILEDTNSSAGIVSLKTTSKIGLQEDELDSSNSFSGPITAQKMDLEQEDTETSRNESLEIECRSLDQVDSLGQILISGRRRCLINWLVNALMKLKYPNTEGISLVRIYGPRIKFDRGPALALNVFDWKGEKVEPVLVQKLADRSKISLGCGFLHHIWFSEKYEEEKAKVIEKGESGVKGIAVVTAALGFLANFEDIYRFWAFVAQFLDADFVEKERWRYKSLSQKTVEI